MTEKEKYSWLEECGYGPKVMKSIRVCPSCGAMVNAKYSSCPKCGMRLLSKTLYDHYRESHLCCDKCGTVLADDSHYCPHCGRSLYVNILNR